MTNAINYGHVNEIHQLVHGIVRNLEDKSSQMAAILEGTEFEKKPEQPAEASK